MKQGDILCWVFSTGNFYATNIFTLPKPVKGSSVFAYWRIKQLKQLPTIQYTFDNPKGKIKLP